MPQRKSDCRLGQACPAFLSIAKSAEAEKAGATQHSAKQLSQSARRLRRPFSEADAAADAASGSASGSTCSRLSDNVRGLLYEAAVPVAAGEKRL